MLSVTFNYLSEHPYTSSHYTKYLALIATIRHLPGTDNLAYLARLSLTKKKKLSLYYNDF